MLLSHVNVSGTEVKLPNSLTTLGVILDNDPTFNNHISHFCKSSLFHLHSLISDSGLSFEYFVLQFGFPKNHSLGSVLVLSKLNHGFSSVLVLSLAFQNR
jgi:hypothetical protein